MCGRFVLLADLSAVTAEFHIRDVEHPLLTGADIRPGQEVSAIVGGKGHRLTAFRWGLIPSWAKDESLGRKLINARAETVAVKPSFRKSFAKRRCLIVADGFYEWSSSGGGRRPWLLRLKNGAPFGLAGLYDLWRSPGGEEIASCTIITTTPNEIVAPIHNRMPVIIPGTCAAAWLDPENRDEDWLLALLKPYPPGEMEGLPAPTA